MMLCSIATLWMMMTLTITHSDGTLIEIAILPGYSKSNLDDMWIQALNNTRLGAPFYPDENFKRFFEVMNVHPRDVLRDCHFEFKPMPVEPYYDEAYRVSQNRSNSAIVSKYFELLNDFEIDSTRPGLCDPETARVVLENAGYGGFPLIAGYATCEEILALDFSKPICLNGNFQIGIWDTLNGSGHAESASKGPFHLNLNRGDLMVLRTKGWTPDDSCGFVGRYYRLELSNSKELIAA